MDTNQAKTCDALDAFMSMAPGRIYFNDESLVRDWLSMLHELFHNSKNELYGYNQQYKLIAEYWLQNGKHRSGCVDPIIIRGQKMWDEYLKFYRKTEYKGIRIWF